MIKFLVENNDLCIAIISIASLIVSILAIFISVYTTFLERKHNILSVMPLIHIFSLNYENEIGVEVSNNGIGPLIITKLMFISEEGEISTSLIKLMPGDIKWKNYLFTDCLFTIPAGDKVKLIELNSSDMSEKNKAREALGKIKVQIEYMDIYKNKNKYCCKFQF